MRTGIDRLQAEIDRSEDRRKAGTTAIAKIVDLGAASPLIAIYAIAVWKLVPSLTSTITTLAQGFDVYVSLLLVQLLATIAFVCMQTGEFLVRRLPLRKAPGVMPRLVGMVGSNSGIALLYLPRAHESRDMLAIATLIVAAGLIASTCCVAVLGRAFSILPQARGFVCHGPYRHIRHPLYLAEQVSAFGLALQFVQPWALCVWAAGFALQIARMHYEEKVMAEAFPRYRAYMAQTARLVPHVY